MILIGRGLDLRAGVDVLSGQLPVRFSRCDRFKNRKHRISGDYSLRVPPVPIPNTEVKPQHADGTWLETARESRSSPDSTADAFIASAFMCKSDVGGLEHEQGSCSLPSSRVV